MLNDLYAKSKSTINSAPENRTYALAKLEEEFTLPEGSLVMYCPTAGMNAKIAEVKIKVDQTVQQFNEYEAERENELSGGHLEAQLKRYKRLWRIHFFIDRKVKEKLSETRVELLKYGIKGLVLGNDANASIAVALALANILVKDPLSKFSGKEVISEKVAAAAYQECSVGIKYPSGCCSISSLIK